MTYSMKDFTGRTLVEAADLDGQTITGSCFSQDRPDTQIFPEGMTGVTFINCNLDNCRVPAGNTAQSCSVRRIMELGGIDWLVDEQNNPIEVLT